MPRIRIGLIAAAFATVATWAVAQQPPAPSPAPTPAAPAPAAAGKEAFALKLEKDKAFYQEMKTEVTQTIKVQGGADLTQKHDQTFLFKWLPTAQTGDKWTVKQTIEGVRMTIDIAGNKVDYDSTKPNEPGQSTNPGLSDFFGKLVGSEFVVTINNKGVVEKVDGKDDFLKKLGGVNPAMEGLLKKMLTDDALKQMTDPAYGLTPDAPKGVGETWEKKSTLSLGPIGSYELTSKYKYTGKDPTKKDLDRVEVTTALKYTAPADQADGLLFKIKGGTLASIDPTPQDRPSFVLYNPKTGRVEESSVSVKMKGDLNVTIGGTDTKIELYQEQTVGVKTQDSSYLPKK